jgi:hypothetical protein
MGIVIRSAVNAEADWLALGPLVCSRGVVRDLCGPVISGDATRWWWASDADRVVAFATLDRLKNSWSLSYAWVSGPYRNRGIYGLMVEARLAYAATSKRLPVVTRIKDSRIHGYSGEWKIKTRRGSWVTLEMML